MSGKNMTNVHIYNYCLVYVDRNRTESPNLTSKVQAFFLSAIVVDPYVKPKSDIRPESKTIWYTV